MRRNAALLVAVSLLSGFGGSAMSLVTGVWLLDLTGSSSLAALAGLCVYAPTLAGPWLGGLLDRAPRRPMLVGVNLALAGVLLTLFAVRGEDQSWLLFAVSLAYGIGYVIEDAGDTAVLPAALPPDRLADVNGWRSSAQEGMKLVAPLAGAGLYAWWGGPAAAVVSAAALVLTAVLYASLRLAETPPADAGEPPTRRGIRAGLAVLRERHALRVTVALAAVAIATSGFQTAATYSLVTTGLGLPAAFIGVLGAAQGAGSIAGGLVVGRFIARRGVVAVGAYGAALFALAMLARCLPWWPLTLATGVIAGVGLPWTLTAAVTAVQTQTPAALLGRVAGTANTVMFGPIALAIPLGAAAVYLGTYAPLLAGAAVCAVAAAAALKGRRATPPPARTSPAAPPPRRARYDPSPPRR
jgi:MFS family permease